MIETTNALENTAAKARAHWTPERLRKLNNGKNLALLPTNGAALLRLMGLLNSDGSMSYDSTRKFLQINHMLQLLQPSLKDLAKRHRVINILDAGCGSSFLTFLLAWYLREVLKHPHVIIGIDHNPTLIERCRQRAAQIGWGDSLFFLASPLDADCWERAYRFSQTLPSAEPLPRPHLVAALHACDTATDQAASLGIKLKADVMALAPCCHAELAAAWKSLQLPEHPLAPVFRTPHLRREVAAQMTDALRLSLIKSRGYEVTATEFIPAEHSPKNRLILAERRGSYWKPAWLEYQRLRGTLGNVSISLEAMLNHDTESDSTPDTSEADAVPTSNIHQVTGEHPIHA